MHVWMCVGANLHAWECADAIPHACAVEYTHRAHPLMHPPLVRAPALRPQADATLEWRTCAALFAAGEVALLREARPPSALVVHVQALTAPSAPLAAASAPIKQEPGCSRTQLGKAPGPARAEGGPQATAAAAAGSCGAWAVPGHAWLCLGKLCLVDEGLAKRVVPLFVQVGG